MKSPIYCMLHRKNTMVFHDLRIFSQHLWLLLLFLPLFLSPLDLRHTKWTNFNHLCAQNLCTMSNSRVSPYWRFLAIFGFFWCWKCYQIDENIFWYLISLNAINISSKCCCTIHTVLIFLAEMGKFLFFWKLIGEGGYLKSFNFGLKWSHMKWRS